MNEDHRHNLLDMARGLLSRSDAIDALMLSADRFGFDVLVKEPDYPSGQSLRIAWPDPLKHSRELRKAMVELSERARTSMP